MTPGQLKLRAEDEEDLAVFSACLQDALVPVADMMWLPQEKRFVVVANRFCWECDQEGRRILSGVAFEGVESVKTQGFSPAERERILELLALRRDGKAILFEFAGEARLRLEAEKISARIDDLGETWPTAFRPHHPL